MANSPLSDEPLFYLPFESEDRGYLFACGAEHVFESALADTDTWSGLQDFIEQRRDWLFGWIAYDAKSSIENIARYPAVSSSPSELFWVVPKHVLEIRGSEFIVHKGDPKPHWAAWLTEQEKSWSPVECKADVSRQEYLEDVHALKQHIHRGDIYEVNYCMRFSALSQNILPAVLFKRLSDIAQAPMMGYASWNGTHLISGSPERFLSKTKDRIIAQPIKGTARRSSHEHLDREIAEQLRQSRKERAENTMIVDLMRNDLSRFAKRGSVEVLDWCGLHTFPTVHHLISTVACSVEESIRVTDILKSTFPMGSMTGAPKVSAMKLIQRYERFPRSLYSGSLGYITPEGDFDLNVIIRSVVYHAPSGQLTVGVGGAITDLSDPEMEYEECLLKAAAIKKALGQ